jgi:hypothetical protein
VAAVFRRVINETRGRPYGGDWESGAAVSFCLFFFPFWMGWEWEVRLRARGEPIDPSG